MIQAIGLTTAPRRNRPLAVDDLSFEARPGEVTVLFGPRGAGKSTALRLMLQLEGGRGVTLFRGRPLHRVPHVAREIGVLLGDVPGHPARTARGHMEMLTAVAGVPTARAEELLDVVGLSGLAEQRLGSFSRGMDRRLGLAAALLGDPHTLVLDDPTAGLTPREAAWMRGMLRGFAEEGGLVLTTSDDPQEALRQGDRIVSLQDGRLVADQDADAFSRTRLRPRVAVTSPHAERLGALLLRESRAADRSAAGVRGDGDSASSAPLEVVSEGGGRISVYGSTSALVGETAYRHGILVHQLADGEGRSEPPGLVPLDRADGRGAPRSDSAPGREREGARGRRQRAETVPLPPRLVAVPAPGPAWPLRYELRRLAGVRSTWLLMAGGLLAALGVAGGLAHYAAADGARLVTAWPASWPLPVIAVVAGLLGALSFGQEFRYPALAPAQAPVPRRLGLLAAKLAVAAVLGILLAVTSVGLNVLVLGELLGAEVAVAGPGSAPPSDWLSLPAAIALAVGSGWAGLLAAAVFRSAWAGVLGVLAVPMLVAPLMGRLLEAPDAASLGGLSERLSSLVLAPLPTVGDSWADGPARMLAQPLSSALALSLMGLLCAYVFGAMRGRLR